MRLVCRLRVKKKNIEHLVQSLDPDNNNDSSKLAIETKKEKNQVMFTFRDFKNLNTLRVTVDDLLDHLKLTYNVSDYINSKK